MSDEVLYDTAGKMYPDGCSFSYFSDSYYYDVALPTPTPVTPLRRLQASYYFEVPQAEVGSFGGKTNWTEARRIVESVVARSRVVKTAGFVVYALSAKRQDVLVYAKPLATEAPCGWAKPVTTGLASCVGLEIAAVPEAPSVLVACTVGARVQVAVCTKNTFLSAANSTNFRV